MAFRFRNGSCIWFSAERPPDTKKPAMPAFYQLRSVLVSGSDESVCRRVRDHCQAISTSVVTHAPRKPYFLSAEGRAALAAAPVTGAHRVGHGIRPAAPTRPGHLPRRAALRGFWPAGAGAGVFLPGHRHVAARRHVALTRVPPFPTPSQGVPSMKVRLSRR